VVILAVGIDRDDAVCDEAEAADARDKLMITESRGAKIAAAREIEQTVLRFVDHLKYPLVRPDKQGQHSVMLMNYLPDLPDTLSYHYARLGWRHHPEKALIKPRRIVGGLFDDLVTYVSVDQPDDPIVVQHENQQPGAAPQLSALPWQQKPVLNTIDEERPDDQP
jgi:hypothetical protein